MNTSQINEVLSLNAAANLGNWNREDYENEILSEDSWLFVAVDSGKVIGVVFARLITPVVEILNLVVLSEERRRGIGSALLRKILKIAWEKKLSESWLEVRESNQAALKFYLRHNYKIVGVRQKYYSDPFENAILMTLVFSDDNPKK